MFLILLRPLKVKVGKILLILNANEIFLYLKFIGSVKRAQIELEINFFCFSKLISEWASFEWNWESSQDLIRWESPVGIESTAAQNQTFNQKANGLKWGE